MKNTFLLTVFLFLLSGLQAQTFIQQWEGNWKGELQWTRTGEKTPQKVMMQLRIHPTNIADTWTWQMIYGEDEKDNRPYLLQMKDSAGIHWVIDERNGIIMDQYWVANKFCGVFSVMGNNIMNNLWLEKDELHVEFMSFPVKPVSTTGNGTEESPKVDSYRILGYQYAILQRVK